ncbi:MAG: NADP-dependent oxidoreductase, partial [Solirubrobacteraceae bacterium]
TDGMRGPANYLSLLVARATMIGMVVFDYAPRFGRPSARSPAGCRKAGRSRASTSWDGGVSAFPDTLLKLFTGENVGMLVLRVGSD